MMGGAERRRTIPVPKGKRRMWSGGRIGTRRMERWLERLPWSPRVMLSVYSSRSGQLCGFRTAV